MLKISNRARFVTCSLLLPLIATSEARKGNQNHSPHATLCGEFEESVELPGSTCKAVLCGVGQRVKKIGPAAFHVYDVGLYVDPQGVAGCLMRWKGEPSEKLSNSKAFCQEARQGVFEKVLIIKMAHEVSAKRIADGLAKSVRPRMPRGEENSDNISKFQEVLLSGYKHHFTAAVGSHSGKINKGTKLGLVCKPNEMTISVNGKAAGTVSGKEVSQAMVDTYLDEDTVSPSAKKAFEAGIARLISI